MLYLHVILKETICISLRPMLLQYLYYILLNAKKRVIATSCRNQLYKAVFNKVCELILQAAGEAW